MLLTQTQLVPLVAALLALGSNTAHAAALHSRQSSPQQFEMVVKSSSKNVTLGVVSAETPKFFAEIGPVEPVSATTPPGHDRFSNLHIASFMPTTRFTLDAAQGKIFSNLTQDPTGPYELSDGFNLQAPGNGTAAWYIDAEDHNSIKNSESDLTYYALCQDTSPRAPFLAASRKPVVNDTTAYNCEDVNISARFVGS